MYEQIENQVKSAKKVVFVTGAGISQESGIPTFRGKDGLWRNYDAMKLATIDAFYDNPKLVWEWYNERRQNIFNSEPNLGHKAIAELENFVKVFVLTQNIDGLHQKAGSSNVLELHGSIVKIKCTVCDFKDELLTEFSNLPPLCKCGNILRPDVVWFGEGLPQDVWQEAIIQASSCDVMIIAGTSLVVSPANTLPIYAKQNNAVLIEINPDETIMSSDMDLSIRSTSAVALPELISIFKKQ
ncbi:MAG: NAD-dependent deacylase [Nitrosopumilaceae archaeon]|uniref:NAD-dependent deacylase n=2 Tax=Candidatus Nitrosomaritimum aestuariumsis TaxID=3342354 RepID=A0AC60WA81_9ARCH|nr:NAD-dependent deacylase [Nitrosopumilaceae archaeon]MBA4460491.1 NAD-dependent deacylase [Nitrosopumilaceae archaeon]MBA4461186.1 NAD-dependent deacylase [Nitrosopumilaceae archaeon]MBA4464243.1 NAD-dependent deacylase [Nitrosopumilaceae archaeon]